jgi:hypothetical protein
MKEIEKQTAVEWLIECLYNNKHLTMNEIFKQAKEMEKQQIKEIYLKGIENYDPTFKNK